MRVELDDELGLDSNRRLDLDSNRRLVLVQAGWEREDSSLDLSPEGRKVQIRFCPLKSGQKNYLVCLFCFETELKLVLCQMKTDAPFSLI